MALPETGSISMSQVNVELGKAATAKVTFNDTAVRALAGAPTGAISLAMLRGKSAEIKMTTTANTSAFNMHTFFGSPTEPDTYILTVNHVLYNTFYVGNFHKSSVIKIINNSQIRGAGGSGYSGDGGHALVASGNILVIENNGEIWGGGGGGGWARAYVDGGQLYMVGGGGGAGWNPGSAGPDDAIGGSQIYSTAGTTTSGGSGGSVSGWDAYIAGGNGGAPGSAGGWGYWNGVGDQGSAGVAGGAAGLAVTNPSGTTRFTTGFNSTAVRGGVTPYPTIG